MPPPPDICAISTHHLEELLALTLQDHLLQLARSDENLLSLGSYQARAKAVAQQVGDMQRKRNAGLALDDDEDPEDEEGTGTVRDHLYRWLDPEAVRGVQRWTNVSPPNILPEQKIGRAIGDMQGVSMHHLLDVSGMLVDCIHVSVEGRTRWALAWPFLHWPHDLWPGFPTVA